MEIRKIEDHGINWFGKQPQALWEIDISGKTLTVERFGSSCYFTGIKIKKDRKEVYELSIKDEERTELFFGKPFRKYSGDQNCFIEYLGMILAKENKENFKAELNARTEKQYQNVLQKIMES